MIIYAVSNDSYTSEIVYKSAEAESISLKYYSFGLDVIATVGEMRFTGNRTLGEIHYELSKKISISEREVQYLIETYMLLVTGIKQNKSYLDEVISAEGMILSLDGVQPEKGNEILMVKRCLIQRKESVNLF